MKRLKLVVYAWDDFSRTFVKGQWLPHGTALHLIDHNGRKKRSDWEVKVKRKAIRSSTAIDGEATVSTLLETAKTWLSTDIDARRLTMRLVSPDGRVRPGNTLVKTVRALAARPTERELAIEEEWREVIDYQRREVGRIAAMEIRQAENGIDAPGDVVLHGYVQALLDHFGADEVPKAVATMKRSPIWLD